MRWSAGILVCFFFFVCTCVQAQRTRYGSIKGTVLDSLTHKPLEATTISVYLSSDSSLVNYALASRRGEFTITDIPLNSSCRVVVSHSGYNDFEQEVTLLPEKRERRLDTIYLAKLYNELTTVTVRALRPPVTVRQDTLEFNVSSFKTMPNGTVEDVLKQLPGAEIDKNGNLLINGKKVTKVMLDGREFFGGDPKIAIKNLPKDIIERLQVMDNKSREQRFNKTATGNEDLALNLTLKKEAQKGWFGKASAGYGSDDRYEANAMLNYFNQSRQINFIGNSNNTNRGGISEDFNISAGRSTLEGGGGGLTTSHSAGLNFSDNLGKQMKLSGSYFYNGSQTDNFSKMQRQNILPDTTFFYNADNNNTSDYTNHRLTLNASYTIDTMSELNINVYFNTNTGASITDNNAISTGLSGQKINSSRNSFISDANGSYLTGEAFFSHRFRKQGRGFTLGFNYNYGDMKSVGDNIGENVYYKGGLFDSRDSVNQRSLFNTLAKGLSVSASYSEPLGKDLTALLRYSYMHNLNLNDKVTNNFNGGTGKYDQEDTAFTNAFRNVTGAHIPDLSFVYNKNKWRASIGSGMQFLLQDNYSITDNSLLHQYYVNIMPSANLTYNFSKSGNLSLFYNGRSSQPSIQQLQPVPDNTNPLYIQLGNPDLKQSFFHNVNMHIRQSNGNTYWFTGLNFNSTQNQIINETFYDSVGRQISIPINVNGNYGFSGNMQYSYTWKRKDWTLRMNLGNNGFYSSNTSFTNKVKITARSFSIAESIGLNLTYKQVLSFMPSFNIRFNKTLYSTQSLSDADFNTKTFSLSAFWNQPKWLIIENNLQYNYNSEIAPGFKKGVVMWSAALNALLFKKQQGIVRLAVYDILKQNAGVYRSITQNFIEDRQTQILQQYFLLSFIYNLRKIGAP